MVINPFLVYDVPISITSGTTVLYEAFFLRGCSITLLFLVKLLLSHDMIRRALTILVVLAVVAVLIAPTAALAATLRERIPEAFKTVYGRQPTPTELIYWQGRIDRKEKTTYQALVGAMGYQKSNAPVTAAIGPNIPLAADDKTSLTKAVLPLFVNIYGNDPTNSEKAWWRKRIACNEIKNYQALVSSMQYHHAKKVRQGSPTICGQSAPASAATSSGVAKKTIAGISTHPMGDQVRIGIFKTDGSPIILTADGTYQIREGASKILATRPAGAQVEVSWSDGRYHTRSGGATYTTTREIRVVPLNQAIVQIKNYSDPSVTYPGKNYNRFRGVIEVRKCDGCGELWAINELRTEYYLRGLAETSGQGPEEYLKALGTAARTYVLYHKVITGGRYQKQKFDIDNTANDQLYRGYEYEIITPRLSSVFNKVKGVIVTDPEGDKPVVPVYFSDSDGRTRSAKEAWNSSRFPHLQSVKDPHHASKVCRGHCVGMSAQGAYGLAAKDQWNFQKILKYYFKGITLTKAY